LGENVTNLFSLMFSKGASEEMVACYFGVDRERKEALEGADEHKSQETLAALGEKLGEWKTYIQTVLEPSERIEEGNHGIIDNKHIFEVKACLDYSKDLGKLYGAILGNWLVGERVSPREVMLHDSSRLLEMLESLVLLDDFPGDLAGFIREKGVFDLSEVIES
jgi:hypothetical protein